MRFHKKFEFDEDKNNPLKINCTLVYLVTPHPACVVDSNVDEIIVGFIILGIVLFTFCKFYEAWNTKLNIIQVITYYTKMLCI